MKCPTTWALTSQRSELIHRLNADKCEYCGTEQPPFEVHHVKKLADLKKKKHLNMWEKVMIARQRKTLVLCAKRPESCHNLLHAGKLPDKRYIYGKI